MLVCYLDRACLFKYIFTPVDGMERKYVGKYGVSVIVESICTLSPDDGIAAATPPSRHIIDGRISYHHCSNLGQKLQIWTQNKYSASDRAP
jgi:hypothetical protein